MKNAPKKIYLQVGEQCPNDADFKELREVTWSDSRVNKNDIEYILKPTDRTYAERLYDGLKGNDYE